MVFVVEWPLEARQVQQLALVVDAAPAPGTLGDPNSLLSLDLRRDSWLGT